MDFQREGDEKRRQRPNGFNRGPLVWGKCTVSHIVKRSKTRFILTPYLVRPGLDHTYKAICVCVYVYWVFCICVLVKCRIFGGSWPVLQIGKMDMV